MSTSIRAGRFLAGGLLAVLLLSGCGMNTEDRVISGAGFGAGIGAITAVATSVNPIVGAAAGGLLGGTMGYTSDPSEINFGKPIWRKRY